MSFNCFGESAKITAALRRGPARYVGSISDSEISGSVSGCGIL
jgi:hypothetical protein